MICLGMLLHIRQIGCDVGTVLALDSYCLPSRTFSGVLFRFSPLVAEFVFIFHAFKDIQVLMRVRRVHRQVRLISRLIIALVALQIGCIIRGTFGINHFQENSGLMLVTSVWVNHNIQLMVSDGQN